MRRFYKLFIANVVVLFTMPVLAAQDLMAAYHLALQNDTTYQAAEANYKATRELVPQGWSNLLPQITGAGFASNHRNRLRAGDMPANTVRYGASGFSLNLRQSVFNYTNWKTLSSAQATVKQAEAQLANAAQNLMLRVSNAYFAVLAAQDDLRFIRAEKRATEKRLDQAQQRYEVGLDAKTAVYEAKASYHSILAQEIAAENAVYNRKEDLSVVTGDYLGDLSPLKELPLISPEPDNVGQWVDMAAQQNLSMIAARYAQIAARENVKGAFGGHLPELNFVASYADRDLGKGAAAESGLNNVKQKRQESIVGVEVSIPLFSGGRTSSQTRQARYQYQEASANEEGAYRQATNSARQSFNSVVAGISKIKAGRQAIISNTASLESTEAAYKVGTRTILDVLSAQGSLFRVQRDHAQDQYTYINSLLSLKASAGLLTVDDLQQINGWLKS